MKNPIVFLALLWCLPAAGQLTSVPDKWNYQADSIGVSWIDTVAFNVDTPITITAPKRAGYWNQDHEVQARPLFAGMGQTADLVKLVLLWREYLVEEVGTDSVEVWTGDGVNAIAVRRKMPLKSPSFVGFMEYLERRILIIKEKK